MIGATNILMYIGSRIIVDIGDVLKSVLHIIMLDKSDINNGDLMYHTRVIINNNFSNSTSL